MKYRTIEGVELATVGMDWPASSGDGTFTFENIADAVEAANNDPHIQLPRIKLGHLSEINGELIVVDPFEALGDAAPAFGAVRNLQLENDGAVSLGDFFELPVWLAEAMPSAYRSRSIEARRDVVTEGGKRYSMVITAVSLLGIYLPAVTDLAELERLLTEGPEEIVVSAIQTPEEGRMPSSIAASVSSGTIRQRFNVDWAMDPDNGVEQDTYRWWARDVLVDPNEVIADDDEGNCWSVSFETDGKDEIAFGEPVRVRETFVPINASAGAVAQRARQRTEQTVLASNLDRPEKPDKPAASAQPDNEENEMSIDLDALRSKLGLPDDATEEQINEALETEETPAENTPITPTDEIPENPEVPAEGEPVAASATLPDGFVAVPADKWEQVQAGAIAGGDLASKTETKRRDDTFTAACKAGKVAPADKDGLYTMHASPETRERFYTLLTAEVKDGGLAKGLVPVTELGEAGGDGSVAASAGLPDAWFPELTTNGASGAKED